MLTTSPLSLAMRDMSKLATPPQLIQYDSWGRRVDELRTSEGWRGLKDIYVREGLVAIAYERKYKEHSRPYGFAKLFIAAADSEVVRAPPSTHTSRHGLLTLPARRLIAQ